MTVRGTSNNFYLYLDYSSFLIGSSQVQTYYWINVAGNGNTIEVYKQYLNSSDSPTLVYLTGTTSTFGDNSVVRVVTRPDASLSGATDVIVYVNNSMAMWYQDASGLSSSGQVELELDGTGNGSNLLSQISTWPPLDRHAERRSFFEHFNFSDDESDQHQLGRRD